MSSTLSLRVLTAGLVAWIIWRLFAPLHLGYVTLYWSVVICFVGPLTLALLWPRVMFEIGQHVMRLYHQRRHWLIMRDLPIASRAAFREVRAEHARRKAA